MPEILTKRDIPADPALAALATLRHVVTGVDRDLYADYETPAKQRMCQRDIDAWPILATALALGCPIWTEDRDFFGAGVATWTTDRVHLFLEQP